MLTPVPQKHTVRLGLTGTMDLVTAAYSVTGDNPGSPSSVLTIPPWQETLTAQDGDTIRLSGTFFKAIKETRAHSFELAASIEVDGKPACKADATAGVASCSCQL